MFVLLLPIPVHLYEADRVCTITWTSAITSRSGHNAPDDLKSSHDKLMRFLVVKYHFMIPKCSASGEVLDHKFVTAARIATTKRI